MGKSIGPGGVPDKSTKVDISVEASCISGDDMQFVTGISFFEKLEIQRTEEYIATLGIHPEDVAAEKVEVGAAICNPPGINLKTQKHEYQYIHTLDLKQNLQFQISSANKREAGINAMEDFIELLARDQGRVSSSVF